MRRIININMGELAIGQNDDKIKTGGIGSCIVIILYDSEARVGGMAHAMLPSGNDQLGKAQDARYADEAIEKMVKIIELVGGKRERLRAKLVGGASMFSILGGRQGIGAQNIESAQKKLKEMGIMIESESIGGKVGKLAEMDLKNGLVEVITKM